MKGRRDLPELLRCAEGDLAPLYNTWTSDKDKRLSAKDDRPDSYFFLHFVRSCRFFKEALMNSLKRGCGLKGFDLNSGWNWQPRNHGMPLELDDLHKPLIGRYAGYLQAPTAPGDP